MIPRFRLYRRSGGAGTEAAPGGPGGPGAGRLQHHHHPGGSPVRLPAPEGDGRHHPGPGRTVQLGRSLEAKFDGIFRHIAAFDSFHGEFSPIKERGTKFLA